MHLRYFLVMFFMFIQFHHAQIDFMYARSQRKTHAQTNAVKNTQLWAHAININTNLFENEETKARWERIGEQRIS